MFVMGIVLDYSNVWPEAKCEMNPGERNYNVCFFMFSLMMFIAFLVATQIQFRYTSYVKPEIPLGNMQNGGAGGKVRATESFTIFSYNCQNSRVQKKPKRY